MHILKCICFSIDLIYIFILHKGLFIIAYSIFDIFNNRFLQNTFSGVFLAIQFIHEDFYLIRIEILNYFHFIYYYYYYERMYPTGLRKALLAHLRVFFPIFHTSVIFSPWILFLHYICVYIYLDNYLNRYKTEFSKFKLL